MRHNRTSRELPSVKPVRKLVDVEWFENLFDLHSTAVRAFAIRRVGHDAADDAVSEVFATAWRRRNDVPEPALPWLLRTARHVVLHEYRKRARDSRVREALVGVAQSGQTSSTEQNSLALAESVLAQLPDVDAEILRLTAWEGLNCSEIAYVLDISHSAARNRLLRARKRARQLLTDEPSPRLIVTYPQLEKAPHHA